MCPPDSRAKALAPSDGVRGRAFGRCSGYKGSQGWGPRGGISALVSRDASVLAPQPLPVSAAPFSPGDTLLPPGPRAHGAFVPSSMATTPNVLMSFEKGPGFSFCVGPANYAAGSDYLQRLLLAQFWNIHKVISGLLTPISERSRLPN